MIAKNREYRKAYLYYLCILYTKYEEVSKQLEHEKLLSAVEYSKSGNLHVIRTRCPGCNARMLIGLPERSVIVAFERRYFV